MLMELHCHTKYSHDSIQCFHFLYWRCLLKKIDFIAITDHNNLEGAEKFDKFCRKRGNKVKVIKGEEIFTNKGEIIGLYLNDEIPAGLSPQETISRIKAQNGVVYVPHPYDEKRYKTVLQEDVIKANLNNIDCIESYNGRNISSDFGNKQTEIADKYGLSKVIGSDSHTFFEVGRNYLFINDQPNDRDTFILAIKNSVTHKSPCIKIAHEYTKLVRIIKLLQKGNFHEIYRIFYRKSKSGMQKMGGRDL